MVRYIALDHLTWNDPFLYAYGPNKSVYDVTFALRFLCSKQMAACKQIRVAYMLW